MVSKDENHQSNGLSIGQLLRSLTASKDPKDHNRILRKLEDVGGDEVYEGLLKLLNVRRGELRYRVLDFLTGINPNRAQHLLIEVLNNDQDSDMRWVASGLLINVATAEILIPLTEALLNHPDVRVRVNIVTALDKLGDKKALPALMHTRDYDTGKTKDGYSVRILAERAIQRIEDHARGQ